MTMATLHYHVTGNLPGYMPDDDPPTFLTFWDALDGLADELERQADDLYERTGMYGPGPYQVEDVDDEAPLLEAEGDRVHAIASAIRTTLNRREVLGRDVDTIDLGPFETWPTSMAVNGIVVYVDTDPASDTHLGWNVHLSPCVEDCDLTDLED